MIIMATPQRKMNISESAQQSAEIRKQHDPEAFRKMGEKGGKVQGTSASNIATEEEGGSSRSGGMGGKMSVSEAGRKGAEMRHSKSPEEESAIAKKAAETRKQHDPEAFRKMGEKGGKARGSSTSNVTEE